METQPRFSLRRPLSLLLSLVMLFTMMAVALPVSAADHNHEPIDLDATYGKPIEIAIRGESDYKMAFDILTKVNAERKKVKKPALEMDKTMMAAAMLRAAECALYYSHTRPTGESCFTVITDHKGAGENIAAGFTSATDVMTGWMNSPGHKANILDEQNFGFKSIGVGVFKLGDTYYFCQLFNGLKKQSTPTEKNPVTKTVAIKARPALLDLSINATKLTVKSGETATLRVTNCNPGFPYESDPIDPSGLTFTPAKTGVVTVSKTGVVTPIGKGSTTISVKSKNGVKLFTVSVTADCKEAHTKHSYTAATCNSPKTCKICGVTSGTKLGHTYKKVVVIKATTTKDGKYKNVCQRCNYTASNQPTIYKASKISLSKTSYTYNGKVQKPSVVVKDSKGSTISSAHYTVTYATGRKNVGTYKVTVKMKGNYSGTKTLTFKINPVSTTVKATAANKSLKLTIGKKATQVTGYQIQYATSKTFKSYKSKTLTGYKTTSATLSGLKAKTTYYVRVRTYKTVNGVKYYSGWSTIVSKKTK